MEQLEDTDLDSKVTLEEMRNQNKNAKSPTGIRCTLRHPKNLENAHVAHTKDTGTFLLGRKVNANQSIWKNLTNRNNPKLKMAFDNNLTATVIINNEKHSFVNINFVDLPERKGRKFYPDTFKSLNSFNLLPNNNPKKYFRGIKPKSCLEALKSDWVKVGGDIYSAMEEYSNEEKKHK